MELNKVGHTSVNVCLFLTQHTILSNHQVGLDSSVYNQLFSSLFPPTGKLLNLSLAYIDVDGSEADALKSNTFLISTQ